MNLYIYITVLQISLWQTGKLTMVSAWQNHLAQSFNINCYKILDWKTLYWIMTANLHWNSCQV